MSSTIRCRLKEAIQFDVCCFFENTVRPSVNDHETVGGLIPCLPDPFRVGQVDVLYTPATPPNASTDALRSPRPLDPTSRNRGSPKGVHARREAGGVQAPRCSLAQRRGSCRRHSWTRGAARGREPERRSGQGGNGHQETLGWGDSRAPRSRAEDGRNDGSRSSASIAPRRTPRDWARQAPTLASCPWGRAPYRHIVRRRVDRDTGPRRPVPRPSATVSMRSVSHGMLPIRKLCQNTTMLLHFAVSDVVYKCNNKWRKRYDADMLRVD